MAVLYREIERKFRALEAYFTPEELVEFEKTPAGELRRYDPTLGEWIRMYMLGEDRLLYCLFAASGFARPDDMSSLMITMFHYYICVC